MTEEDRVIEKQKLARDLLVRVKEYLTIVGDESVTISITTDEVSGELSERGKFRSGRLYKCYISDESEDYEE